MRPLSMVARTRLLAARGGVLGTLFDRLAAAYGDRRVVEQPGGLGFAGGKEVLTYQQAAAVVALAADRLHDIYRDHNIVIRGRNGYDFFLACLAVSRAGGVIVPVNPHASEEEVDYVIKDADAEVVSVEDVVSTVREAGAVSRSDGRGWQGKRKGSRRTRPSDVAGIFYTSGTTGRPKGAVLTHRGVLDQPSRMLLLSSLAGRYEVVMGLPVAHIMGFIGLLGAAIAGIPTYFLPHFNPVAALDAIESRKANAFLGVPAMYRMMLDAGAERRDLRSVRIWMSAADIMPEDLASTFKKMGATLAIPGIDLPLGEAIFAEGYGMVELSGIMTVKISPPFSGFGLGEFMGIPLPPYRYRVVDADGRPVPPGTVGELMVAGPGVLKAYHAKPSATRDTLVDGRWVKTGDLVRRDRFGIIYFAGRKKDVLKHGGFSVFPPEVEAVLRAFPGVANAAVVGQPDPVKGEVPVAYVEPAPGAVLDPDEIMAYAAGHLAEYKRPVRVIVEKALPRTGTNKIAKNKLRERLKQSARA